MPPGNRQPIQRKIIPVPSVKSVSYRAPRNVGRNERVPTDLDGIPTSGVMTKDMKEANQADHKSILDVQILGLTVSRAAAEGVDTSGFNAFVNQHFLVLKKRQLSIRPHSMIGS